MNDLTFLYLSSNQLDGSIPNEFGKVVKLRDLWLDNNFFSGEIPIDFGGLINLGKLLSLCKYFLYHSFVVLTNLNLFLILK